MEKLCIQDKEIIYPIWSTMLTKLSWGHIEEFKKIKLEEVCIKRWNKRKDMWQFIYQIEK